MRSCSVIETRQCEPLQPEIGLLHCGSASERHGLLGTEEILAPQKRHHLVLVECGAVAALHEMTGAIAAAAVRHLVFVEREAEEWLHGPQCGGHGTVALKLSQRHADVGLEPECDAFAQP